jgi:hypothetical protein
LSARGRAIMRASIGDLVQVAELARIDFRGREITGGRRHKTRRFWLRRQIGPQIPRLKVAIRAKRGAGKRIASCTFELFMVIELSPRRTRRARGQAHSISRLLGHYVSSHFKPAAQLHEKRGDFDLCEFGRIKPGRRAVSYPDKQAVGGLRTGFAEKSF